MTAIVNQGEVNMRAVFRKFDKDSDGFISVKDLISVFKELGEDIRDEELKEHLHNAGESERFQMKLRKIVSLLPRVCVKRGGNFYAKAYRAK